MCAAAVATPLGIPIEKNDHLLPPITPLFSLLTTELRLLLLSLFKAPRPRCPIIHMRCDDDDAGRTVEVVLGPAAPCAGADAASPRPCDERAAATAATLRGAARALGVELRCVDTRETDPITVGVARDLRRRRLLPGWQARRGAAADVAVGADRSTARRLARRFGPRLVALRCASPVPRRCWAYFEVRLEWARGADDDARRGEPEALVGVAPERDEPRNRLACGAAPHAAAFSSLGGRTVAGTFAPGGGFAPGDAVGVLVRHGAARVDVALLRGDGDGRRLVARDGFAPPPGDGRLHATLALGSRDVVARGVFDAAELPPRPVVAAAAALPDYAAVYALDGVRLGEKARRPDGAPASRRR